MRLFTFGLVYSDPIDMVEEIDVRASSYEAARAEAEKIAAADYMPGWDRIESLQAGGEFGTVTILS